MAKAGKRFMKLAGMTASISGKVAKNSLGQLSRDQEKREQARKQMMQDVGMQIADTLGEMKGAVMKVGQIASQYQEVFPPEVAESLKKLQNNAPPMPFDIIKQQVESELGQPITEIFYSFEQESFASASIGQVHKAVLFDEQGNAGQEVVVKVQYPHVEENIDSDLKHVRMALKLSGILNISKELQNQIFSEISHNLRQELDYQQEAENVQKFYDFYADNDNIIIPRVIRSHSTKRILTLSCEFGEPLSLAKEWDNQIKQKIAFNLFHFSASQLFTLQNLHCDPHPGNFAFRHDGSIIAYDFGAVRQYTDTEVQLFKNLLNNALQHNIPAVEQSLIDLNIRIDDGVEIDPDFYQQWIDICLEPLSVRHNNEQTDEFDFAHSDTHHKVISQLKHSVKYIKQFHPSVTTMMVDRTVSGQYWNLVNLEVCVDLSQVLQFYTD